jgi:LPXTG-motif cell wall-anchored protein
MNLVQFARKSLYRLLTICAVCLALAAVMMAQDTSTTSVKKGAATQQAKVERGEVVYVSGNDIVVKMESGEVRHVTVPEGATAMVDGKQITIKDLKPGMKLERTITVTTTPKMVTTVRTIQGKVWSVHAPTSVILTLPEGNKQYKIPKDQKFKVDGKEVTAFDLKKGMMISATVLTQATAAEIAEQKKVTGSAPPPPPTPAMEGALLIEEPAKVAPAPAPAPEPAAAAAAPEPTPKKLPKTGSMMPLVGLLGILSCALSLGMRKFRR